jgi:signal transduction histidine kinase
MRFWQRAYFSILILFVFCFDLGLFLASNFSYRSSLSSERERAFGEAHFITVSIEKDIAGILSREGDIRMSGYSFFVPYANYYKDRDVYLELWKNDEYFIGSIPDSPKKKYQVTSGEQTLTTVEYGSEKYMIVLGSFQTYSDDYTLIYAHNMRSLTMQHAILTRFFMMLGGILITALAAGLYIMLRRLSKPIENLDLAAARILNGDFSMRVPVTGKDELAALAQHFNSMAEEVAKRLNELQEGSSQKQRFIDNLAHELRTPLTVIRGYAEYIKNANISEDDKISSIDFIISQAVRIEEMAGKLLDLALLRSNSLTLMPIGMEEVFRSLSMLLQPKLNQKNLSFEIDCTIPSVNGDRDLIECLLYNLIDNAIKASNDDSMIQLFARSENGFPVITITDFGKGISNQHLLRLTEPFYRVDQSRSRSEGGVGLGLALCEQIATLHKATIHFSSQCGKGTQVKISFATP